MRTDRMRLLIFNLPDCGCDIALPVSLMTLSYVLWELSTHSLSCIEHTGVPSGPKKILIKEHKFGFIEYCDRT